MDQKYKSIAAKCAREGKTKLELMLLVPKSTIAQAREINLFFEVSKEILQLEKAGETEDMLRKVILKLGFESEDLELILGKNSLEYSLKSYSSMLVSLILVLVFVFVFGSMFLSIISNTDWDFLKQDFVVRGIIFGDDVNFSDLKISSNAVLKNVLINGNEYSVTVRCSKDLTLSFSKKGFVPVHKNILCEDTDLDIVFATMKEFVKLSSDTITKVEDRSVKLDLAGSDLVVLGTNTPAVNPSVSVSAFNPNTPGDMQFFPGELEGLLSDGNVTAIESYGFAKIIAEDENGNSLDFKEGASAKLTFVIDEAQRENAPSEMPLWYFDEDKGIWVEEGLAKKVCNGNACIYVGEMNKVRSFWNADYPVPTYTKDINDWNAQVDDGCSSDKPKKISGKGNVVYKKDGTHEIVIPESDYICCPADTKNEDVVFVDGHPTQCSCSGDKPKKFFISSSFYGTRQTDVCCQSGATAVRYDIPPFGSAYETCGCSYGKLIDGQKQICKGVCTVCEGEKIVDLSKNYSGAPDCKKEVLRDCSQEGKVCVEHIYSEYADPIASCESCPSSLNFVTGTDNMFANFYDGYRYVGFGRSSNTIYGASKVSDVFNKISQVCKSCTGKGRFLNVIINDHANVGFQTVGSERLNVNYMINHSSGYDFSCLNKLLLAGCNGAEGPQGRNFLNSVANGTGATVCGSTTSVIALYRFDIGWRVNVTPNNNSTQLHTIFYSTSNDLAFPGMPSEAYQTKILSGELGEVKVSVLSSDSSRNKLAYLDDNAMMCSKNILDSREFTINSSIKEIVFGNFRVEIPKGSVANGKTVRLQVNLLDVNCTDFEDKYWIEPVLIDSDYLVDIKNAVDLNVLSKFDYEYAKTLYDNNWVCLEDSDCFGPCPMGDLNCSYGCNQNHECEITSSNFNLRYVPSTSTIVPNVSQDSNSNSKLFSSNNKYSFITLGQSVVKRSVRFEDIGKNITFTYSGSVSPRIAFTINNVPSTPKSWSAIPSSGAVFDGYSLNNCSLWNGYPTDLADCMTGYDSLFGLNSNEALDFTLTRGLSAKDKGIVYTKLADYYKDVNFCYYAFSDGNYYSGLACIKMVDEEKQIDSNQNILNIVNKNMSNYSLSFVLRNLSEYYWDINYCYPIPTESQKLACIARFPKPPEVIVPKVLCGNGIIDEKEKCDGNNFGNLNCESYGFNSGKLFCVNCQLNKSGCYNTYEPKDPKDPEQPDRNDPEEPELPQVCGNNIIEGNEDCDTTNFDGLTCADYGFNSGTLTCDNCRVNSNACVNITTQTCGNNIIEGTEQCEGTNLNGRTCETYGFNSGTLSCSNCQIVNRNCKNIIAPPAEIDPLEIFDCPYDGKYSSPIKDNTNNTFWIKVIRDSKIFAYKVPYKKINCVGETVLTEDASGNIIPCITQVPDSDGCIIEKRELGGFSDPSDKYIEIGKYELKYKQNPVDFVGGEGNVYFMTLNAGKHEFVKFSSTNTLVNERIQVYDANDYTNKTVPGVLRAMASGNVIWVVLRGALYNIHVAPGNYGVMECRGYSGNVYSGCNGQWGENNCYGMSYGDGIVFMSKNYSGEEISRVRNEVYCRWTRSDILDSHTGTASISGYSFDPTKMTYIGDGYGNLVVRMSDKIVEYSTDSIDSNAPSVMR